MPSSMLPLYRFQLGGRGRLETRRQITGKVSSYRGCCLCSENTLASFREALRQRRRHHRTGRAVDADGQVVVFSRRPSERTTDGMEFWPSEHWLS
jgi:hypothetical protein